MPPDSRYRQAALRVSVAESGALAAETNVLRASEIARESTPSNLGSLDIPHSRGLVMSGRA